ncbi:hypothetical protein WJX77_004370 [Trebouxia sp. C0004]
MLTRQLSLCASKRWPFLSLKNLQSCQLTTASTSNTPNLAAGVKRRCAIQAAANSAAESGTPASFVLSAARELADAGVSAAGLATYAEKASRIPFLLRCRILNISGNDANPLADCLLSFGALSVSTEEYAAPGQPEQEVFQDGSGRTWDRCTVTGLFASEHNIAQTLQVVQDVLTITVTQHQIEEVPDQEWVNAMKDSYQPTEVCKGLWIVPDWCETPDPSALNIRMAPGLAFGTGEHSTTRLCLQWLFDRRDKIQGAHVMDYGTGSGVLAVAALLMGAASAVGTDVDPLAVKAAKDNAALNSVGDRLIALQCSASVQGADPLACIASSQQPMQFDICIANILQGPLLDLQPRLSAYVKPGGHLLLSGILESQVTRVQDAYQSNVADMQYEQEKSWALLTGVKQ